MIIRRRSAMGAGCLLLGLAGWGAPVAAPPCDAPDADPFVGGLRERTLAYNELARYTIAQHGEPVSCEGSVTAEFDGMKFGALRLGFVGDVALEVETMPPESSVLMLTAPPGFEDAAGVRRAVESYAAGIGLRIDWEAPTIESAGARRIESYADPDPGLNAFVRLTYANDVLVAVRVSMAL